ILEPVKGYRRVSSKGVHYTTHSPYSRVVDAARPDARVSRNFNMLVDTFLKRRNDKKVANDVRNYLRMWANNYKVLEPVIRNTPILKEVEPLSSDLNEISRIGLQAMVYLKSGKRLRSTWRQNALGQIKQASKSHGQVELAVIKGIRKLVENVK
ncbi:MAG TPA: hypothetical protein VIH57_17020, partial [Bacteroidales bacterium]